MGTMETRIFLPGAREKLINDRSKECSGSLKRGNFKEDKAKPPAPPPPPPPEATCFPLSKSDLWESMIRGKRKGRKKEGKGERGQEWRGGKEDGGGERWGRKEDGGRRGHVLSRKRKEMKKVPFDISYLVNVHSLSNFSPQHGFFFFF